MITNRDERCKDLCLLTQHKEIFSQRPAACAGHQICGEASRTHTHTHTHSLSLSLSLLLSQLSLSFFIIASTCTQQTHTHIHTITRLGTHHQIAFAPEAQSFMECNWEARCATRPQGHCRHLKIQSLAVTAYLEVRTRAQVSPVRHDIRNIHAHYGKD